MHTNSIHSEIIFSRKPVWTQRKTGTQHCTHTRWNTGYIHNTESGFQWLSRTFHVRFL